MIKSATKIRLGAIINVNLKTKDRKVVLHNDDNSFGFRMRNRIIILRANSS